MKKTLRSLALAALALPLAVSAEITMKTVWMNGVNNGTANPIPGLDAGWNKATPTHQSTATCSRFGVGKDGKILTTNHTQNAIVAWDGQQLTTFKTLPAVTDDKWNGTVLATDDAGNVIFNCCFTDANKSLQYWGVIDKDGNLTEVTLSTPLEELTDHTGRIDIISHIVGDVNSTEGGIGYSTNKGSGRVVMFHFKGDGTKVTSLTATMSSEVEYLKALTSTSGATFQTETWQPAAKYSTVAELLQGNAADNFYLGIGVQSPNDVGELPSISQGMTANFENGYFSPLFGIGNRFSPSRGVVYLGGKKYIIASYMPGETPVISAWCACMSFGLFTEDGELVASWNESSYANGYGSETITVEQIDENSANIYIYVATGVAEETTGTTPGAYAAMIRVADEVAPDGTENNPYIIETKEDLCNAWSKMKQGATTYFVQTADIDMEGVTDWIAFNGYNGSYDRAIHYDGQNHVIKNFAPVDRVAGTGENAYYCTTVFGVLAGTVKNLGIVDAKAEADWYEGGILAGFFGGSWVAGVTHSIDNVFVTGTTIGTSKSNVNGAIGTSAAEGTITNFYAQVKVENGADAGGIIGKAGANLNISNSYVSATVAGTNNNLVGNGTITASNVIAFGEGTVPAGVTRYPANSADGIEAVQTWDAFNQGVLLNGLPAFNWQGSPAGISDIVTDEADAPAVYYNLQGVEVANPDNGIYIVRRGNKVTKEIIR